MPLVPVDVIVPQRIIELPCGHHIAEDWLLSRAASVWAKRAKTGGSRQGSGRPKVFRPCGKCGVMVSAAADAERLPQRRGITRRVTGLRSRSMRRTLFQAWVS